MSTNGNYPLNEPNLVVSVGGTVRRGRGNGEGLAESHLSFEKEQHEFVAKYGDLSDESARVAMVKAMVVNHVFPSFDLDGYAFERRIARLPSGTMRQVIATFAKALKANSEAASVLAQSFQSGRVAKHIL